MLRSSSEKFKLYYYVSSLFPIHISVLVFIFSSKLENNNCENLFKVSSTSSKITILIMLLSILVDLYSLVRVIQLLNNQKKLTKALGTNSVRISNEYNGGLRDFLLSFIVPAITTFSADENPLTMIIFILLFQFIVYVFYKNSSDFFPNISLMFMGYSVFKVDTYDLGGIEYVFGKTKNIDDIILKKVDVIMIGDKNYPNNVAIILEKKV